MEYYADLNGKFIGTFQKGGYWVASYNSPLLTKSIAKNALLRRKHLPYIHRWKKKKGKSGADVWIFTPLIDEHPTTRLFSLIGSKQIFTAKELT